MWWALCALLSCGTESDYSYNTIAVNQPIATFAVGLPLRDGSWIEPPNIRICEDSGVSVYRITHAVSFWRKLGYKFGSLVVDPSPSCMNAYRGEILITLPEGGFDSSQIASTRVSRRVADNAIVKAKIFIMPRNARKSRVLEHELGHALGWAHYNQKFHMMHPSWLLGGYDSKGLRNDG